MKYLAIGLCLLLIISTKACLKPILFFKDIPLNEGKKEVIETDALTAVRATRQVLAAHDFAIKEDIRLPNGTNSIIAEHISTQLIESKDAYPSGFIRVLVDVQAANQAQVIVFYKALLRKSLVEKNASESARATLRFFLDLEKRVLNIAKN